MKHILFILDDYPTESTNGCVFARKLIVEMLKKGVSCTVIAPQIVSPQRIKSGFPYHAVDNVEGHGKIEVFRPWYFHLSSNQLMIKGSMNNHFRSVLKTIKRENLQPDYVYGHFIYQCGITAARIGKIMGIPSFCAVGENSNRLMLESEPYATGRRYGNWCSFLMSLSGIISVSEYNRKLLYCSEFIEEGQKVCIAPNGIDIENFHYIDKTVARKRLGFHENCFIVAFTGAFSERKGFYRLSDALEKLDNVYSIFMGQGADSPQCKNVLWSGSVPNNELKYYLCSADVFVLPTNGEGCCNAIIEALACGLPVISSDMPFNDGILTEDNSIRIDVSDVNAIVDAITKLKDNVDLRKKLAAGALSSAENMSNSVRATNILHFMGITDD